MSAQFKTFFHQGQEVRLKSGATRTIQTRSGVDGVYLTQEGGEVHEDEIDAPTDQRVRHHFQHEGQHYTAIWNEGPPSSWDLAVSGSAPFAYGFKTLEEAKASL